ncbi:hypothetical protein O9992_09520 [Vibrio lentus]|nr:hypothetical protein [Vibrio lentus]
MSLFVEPSGNPFIIDAAVEGICYNTSSGLNSVTNSEDLRLKLATLLPSSLVVKTAKVIAASNRDVLTPFEAAGKLSSCRQLFHFTSISG